MSRMLRKLQRAFFPGIQGEGDGAQVRRIIGGREVRNLDPFLMLDHAEVHKPHGFPDHPHRGFETVSYILEGVSKHEDFKGHSGEIHAGGIQWMTAGRGIVHSEAPVSDRIVGLQLWVNLKSTDKLCEPFYQEKSNELLSKAHTDGIDITIIAGQSLGIRADTITKTPITYIDISMQKGAIFQQEVENNWNAFVYILKGKIKVDDTELNECQAGIFNKEGNLVVFEALDASRFVFFAGRPIGEKIVQYGPFVMNQESEIDQAMRDYSMGINGFEGARTWKSRISRER
ncbi:hypothetical protein SteCoe_20104 [Stentor coeruleus]|uniref:Pirin n=1 Tax=Stentor coeruleus TaxID=5963 RepID=A0A1R2BSR5_9CILI|nr:hypothetical protein SteCoe_20104 [Stentor coeruleus]